MMTTIMIPHCLNSPFLLKILSLRSVINLLIWYHLELIYFQIPLIHVAQNLTKNNIKLYGSLWTAPKWIKTNGEYLGGVLKDDMYQVYANYFVKFLDAYKDQGVSFWGLTTGNEPSIGNERRGIPSVGWTGETQVSLNTNYETLN